MAEKRRSVADLDENMRVKTVSNDIVWHDPTKQPFTLSGFAWYDAEQTFRRLPSEPVQPISERLDELANHTTGGQIRFRTNALKIAIKVTLSGIADMNHMPATGQCGFDCYVDGAFVATSIYNHLDTQYEVTLVDRGVAEMSDVTLNFPLYQGVEDIVVGLNGQAVIEPPPAYDSAEKIIFYGTSITQGGCAARPGMAYPNILSRRFNLECFNLGFSGNGKGEREVAQILTEIADPALLVLNYEPNCASTADYKQTLPAFIETYRAVHKDVPILLVSKFPYAGEVVNPQLKADRLERLAFQETLVQQLQTDGDAHVHFLPGTDLLGTHAQESTVDGIHPTDLGFINIADALEPVIRTILP